MKQVRAISIRYFKGIVNWSKRDIKANGLKKRKCLRTQRDFHIQVQHTEAAYEVERGRIRTSEHPVAIQNERDKISKYIREMVPRDKVVSEYLRQEKPHGDSSLYHLLNSEWDKTPKPVRNYRVKIL